MTFALHTVGIKKEKLFNKLINNMCSSGWWIIYTRHIQQRLNLKSTYSFFKPPQGYSELCSKNELPKKTHGVVGLWGKLCRIAKLHYFRILAHCVMLQFVISRKYGGGGILKK